jgi:hypothetical protein
MISDLHNPYVLQFLSAVYCWPFKLAQS